MKKITLSGLAGTGTSTVGRAVAKKLNLKFVSSGDFCRQLGAELGLTINQFDELCKIDSSYDKKVDQRMVEFGKNNDNFLAEGRMTWYFIPDAFKIKLDCTLDERIRRIGMRENKSTEIALKETLGRQEVVADRFKNAYKVENCADNGNFDMIIDTTNISVEEVVNTIIKSI